MVQQISSQKIEHQLGQITKGISAKLKTWGSKGGEPSVPEIAECIRTWQKDIENLAMFSDLNGPAFQATQSAMLRAWNVRDDRKKSIPALKEVLTSIKGVPGELGKPAFVKSYQTRNMKGLVGDFAARYANDPNLFGELFPLRRQIQGFMTTVNGNVDPLTVNSVKTGIIDIAERYDVTHPIHQNAVKAIEFLNRAADQVDIQGASERSYKAAAQAIDQMGVAAEMDNAPQGYAPELKGYAAKSVHDEVEELQRMFYGYKFTTPQEFLPRAKAQVNTIHSAMRQNYDPKAERIVNTIAQHINDALGNARSVAAKSLGSEGWDADVISIPVNAALDRVDALSRHLQDNI